MTEPDLSVSTKHKPCPACKGLMERVYVRDPQSPTEVVLAYQCGDSRCDYREYWDEAKT